MSATGCPDIAVGWNTGAASPNAAAPAPATQPAPTVGAGVGTFLGTPNFGMGANASAVFAGGSVAQLEAAAKASNATGVWVQTSTGGFELLVIGSPAFLRDAFTAKFQSGVSGPIAVTLVR